MLVVLCWQSRLAALRLPTGVEPLRRLEQPLIRLLCQWLPDPYAGDGPRDNSQCRMM